ncbi:two-component system response regulator TorR [Moritella viscosa]|uniref:DNA-binding response regulator TorR n=1 Tax=Moritella viscosa TaxID=80854 RepID=A0A1L0AGJ6_9GAMM|nr:two-component system response regulator TorR [Moritella viscosa]SGZ15585.1 DNA-binding response regulator TorR [Moritella viscosa]SHO11154.1 DNA-binding response regulator TorR [Moritella viscosa]SHO11157.1 DNA-binding response regulator TorR [Moritella viscosa]SHO17509.1 DNA-binding response regulator TorR [Moritella viscosa]SHO17815.1 DNA-binding response regulator TorR [Moritella viscosa]
MKNKHILVVEDEAITRAKLVGYFQHEGYQVSEAASKAEMNIVLANHQIDLVMLDINLPDEDGLMITRTLRSQSNIGIMLVTGRSDAIDKIVGLEMGADDYVTKPFEFRELLVRVKNLLWRISLTTQAKNELANAIQDEVNDELFYFGSWSFDIAKRKLCQNDEQIKLTKAEYEILVAFTAHPERVLSRERLLNLIDHRVEAPNDRTIDVLVRRLRNKIELDPKNPEYFVTVHGEGYLFAAELSKNHPKNDLGIN